MKHRKVKQLKHKIKTNREQRILNNIFESYSKTMLNTIKKNEQKTFKKVYKQYLKARYFFKEDCQAVLKEYRPMRNIGMMIKKFFNPKCQQYWICVPSRKWKAKS